MSPVYFVIAKRNGVEHAELYHDELPRAAIPNRVYVLRLDTMPNGEQLMAQPLSRLFAMYRRLARSGKLPPGYEPPKRK